MDFTLELLVDSARSECSIAGSISRRIWRSRRSEPETRRVVSSVLPAFKAGGSNLEGSSIHVELLVSAIMACLGQNLLSRLEILFLDGSQAVPRSVPEFFAVIARENLAPLSLRTRSVLI
jgi:hypothetical protein